MYLVPDKDNLSGHEGDAFSSEDSKLVPDDILFQETEVGGPRIRYGYRTGGMRFTVP